MNKIKYIISLLFILVTACNQDSTISNIPNKKVKVTFNVSMDSKIIDFAMRSNTDGIKHLNYYAKYNNEYISQITQLNSDSDFGNITDELPIGTNTIYFIGHNSTECNLNQENSTITFDKISDTFIYSKDIEVKEEGANINPIVLERAVGKLEIIGEDAIPNNAKRIVFSLTNYYSSYSLVSNQAMGDKTTTTREWEYTSNNFGKENVSYSIYSFISDLPNISYLSITSYDLFNNIIKEINIPNIQLYKNKIVKYTGKLFTPETTENSFNISIDKEWDETIDIGF